MKKNNLKRLTWLFAAAMCLSSYAQQQEIIPQNTIKVEAGDTDDVIIRKAAHVVPTDNQLAALRNEFIAFVHFGPNTFTRLEWGTGKEDPKIFDLKTLDTDQWCQAMKAAGMKMVVFTAKHHDGFVLWQSRYTKHGIMSTGYKNGKGDVMKELSASCRKYGLKLGVYLSPADLYQIESPDGLYGNLSPYTLRTIPREVPGRPFAVKTKFQLELDDYNEYFLNQLFELLTEYGPIDEVWFDGAHPKTKGGQKYNYKAWREMIRTLVPNATIFGREDVRWCGNEAGNTRTSEWNVITPYTENPAEMVEFMDLHGDLGGREVLLSREKPFYLHYQPAETNTSIRAGWFYRDDTRQQTRSADDVFDIYERAVGGNSIFLLNIPPNREGRFSDADVEVLEETGRRIQETYGHNLLDGADGPKEVLDKDENTFVLLDGEGPKELVFSVPQPITFNRIVIQEAIATHSERVEKHAVDAWVDGQWKEVARSTNIGHKRILRFPDVTSTKIRIRILESRMNPAICEVSAHYYQQRPPMLSVGRNAEGLVTIAPKKDGFSWLYWADKKENESMQDTIDYQIHYTTDGTEPDEASPLYTVPFALENGEVKAVSFLHGRKGAVSRERLGFVKKDWKVLDVSGETTEHPASAAIDEQADTYWVSGGQESPYVFALDLGMEKELAGFAYTPQKKDAKGLIAAGRLEMSADGKTWKKVEDFTFGNLVNDPTKRYHYFKKAVKARYVRLVATEVTSGADFATMAELDIF